MGLTEGLRASQIDRIKNDKTDAPLYLGGTGDSLKAAGKGLIVGAATGAAGAGAGTLATKAGAGTFAKGTATAGAEIATMPPAAAAVEGRLPEAHEFLDAAILIAGMKTTFNQRRCSNAT